MNCCICNKPITLGQRFLRAPSGKTRHRRCDEVCAEKHNKVVAALVLGAVALENEARFREQLNQLATASKFYGAAETIRNHAAGLKP